MTATRPARPDDLPGVAALLARLNAHPSAQSLHCAARTPGSLRRALLDKEDFPFGWERQFVVHVHADGGLLGVFGAQLDPDRTVAWLWGPWLATEKLWSSAAPAALLDALLACLPASVRRLDAFLHAEHTVGLRFLRTRGFSPGPATHIYVVPRSAWPGAPPALFPPLRPAHEVAFARLHADTFPAGGSTPAQVLLDGRDPAHAIFAAADGLRLLGSVCVSVNRAPSEGFIDYLAVKPSARGRGVGAQLLQTALHWTFETYRLPQAALCVSNWRDGARRLYAQAGFQPQATGIAMRRRV